MGCSTFACCLEGRTRKSTVSSLEGIAFISGLGSGGFIFSELSFLFFFFPTSGSRRSAMELSVLGWAGLGCEEGVLGWGFLLLFFFPFLGITLKGVSEGSNPDKSKILYKSNIFK